MNDFLNKYCAPKAPRPLTQKAFDTLSLASSKQFLEDARINTALFKKQTIKVWRKLDPITLVPKKGEQLRVRTQSQLNMISVVIALLGSGTADEVTISTYTLNTEAFNILCDLVKKQRIKKLSLVIASSYSFRDKDHKQHMISECLRLSESYQVSLVFVWSHLKITLLKIKKHRYLVEGSMNYSQNNMAEQILIEDNPEMYAHDEKFLNETIFDTENKALEKIC